MPSAEFEGNTYNVDEDGFIDDFNNWKSTDLSFDETLQIGREPR